MPLAAHLLQVLRCPACVHTTAAHSQTDTGQLHLDPSQNWLICQNTTCGRKYPIRHSIPVMLIREGDRWIDVRVTDLPHPNTLPDHPDG